MKKYYLFLLLAAFISLSSSITAGQEAQIAEPEYIGVIYYQDSSGRLLALDRQLPRAKASLRALGFGGARLAIEADGKRAALRVPSDQKTQFVVQLAIGIDPRKINLIPFNVKDGKRVHVIPTGNLFKGYTPPDYPRLNITRFGQNSYKLTPVDELPPGEYAFTAEDSTDLFCFGIDK